MIAQLTSEASINPEVTKYQYDMLVFRISYETGQFCLLYVQVRDNYLQTIDNIQQADEDAVFESQQEQNSSTRSSPLFHS